MSNSILTIDMITRKALEILENNLVITRNVNRQYDDSFAVEGAKIGSTLRIRKPDRALVTDGAALQVQDDNEQYTTLSVSSQKHIGVNFTSAELTMQLDDFADRVLKPRISQLASSIDADVANAYKSIYQSVGTAGTTPATSLVLLQAQQKLNEAAANMSPRYATVNAAANAGLVDGMKGLFNPTDTVSQQFRNGMMGTGVLGFEEINMSQSIVNHTTGTTPAVPIVATTVATQGQATLAISFTSGSPTFKVGDVFTIGSVYSVNPQTRQSTGSLQQSVYLRHQEIGTRAVIIGAEHVSFSAVMTLAHADVQTVAMITPEASHQSYFPLHWATALRYRYALRTQTHLLEILGRDTVTGIRISSPKGEEVIECDVIVFTADWIPDHELARRGGLQINPATKSPIVNDFKQTSRPGVLAIGNLLLPIKSADQCALEGASLLSKNW